MNRAETLRTIETDVISSSTPLEMQLAGIHPRCHVRADHLARIRARRDEEPYRSMLSAMQRAVDGMGEQPILAEGDNGEPIKTANFQAAGVDKRGYGDRIPAAAAYYAVTGDTAARDLALETMRALADYREWGSSLTYGHWAHGMACGIDWLWDDLDAEGRDHFLDVLYARTEHVFGEWSSYRSGEPFGYTWNIMGVILGGLSAAAGVLYGERPDVARFVNLVTEKARCTAYALGDDGVSPEGVAYGGYFALYACVAFTLIRDLVGVDLFRTCEWFRNYPRAILLHTLPRNAWTTGGRYFQFGDAHGDGRGGGHSSVARACAAAYGDAGCQWLADMLSHVVPDTPSGDALSLFWIEPDIQPEKPDDLPLLKHFENLDIVIGRAGWDGGESVFGLKCGPAAGHRGIQNYPNPLAGGHMSPSSGVVQVFAHGDWILPHPNYTWKRTAYHNCLLVDGKGQRGEESEWFEDLSYRQGAPSPCVRRAEPARWGAYVLADVGPAYPEEAGVCAYYRHLFSVHPDCWIVIDAIEFGRPATPEVLFHSRRPFSEAADGSWCSSGELAQVRIRSLLPDGLTHVTEAQAILHSSGYEVDGLELLSIAPSQPVTRHLFATAVLASGPGEANDTEVSCVQAQAAGQCEVSVGGTQKLCLTLDPWRPDGAWTAVGQ